MRRGSGFLRGLARAGALALAECALLATASLAQMESETPAPEAAGAEVAEPTPSDEIWLIRCGRIETGTGEVIEKGAILVVNGKIKKVGRSMKVPVSAREIDARNLTVVPGFVHSTILIGQDRDRSVGNQADQVASQTFYPFDAGFEKVLKEGFTTLALMPSGGTPNGIPGRAAVLQPTGEDGKRRPGAAVVRDAGVLCVSMIGAGTNKDLLRKAFEKVDEAIEKLKEAKEKWEEKMKKKSSSKKSSSSSKSSSKQEEEKKEDKEKEGEKEKEKEEVFKAPRVDSKTQVVWDWLEKDFGGLVFLRTASDLLHWLEVTKDRELGYACHVNDGNDAFEVVDRFAELKTPVLLNPQVSAFTNTRYRVNPAAIFDKAGVTVGFAPSVTSGSSLISRYRHMVCDVVKNGFPREKAIAAMTSVPARALGIADEYGSIQPGRYADLVFFEGDPLDVLGRVKRVMIRGKVVYTAEDER